MPNGTMIPVVATPSRELLTVTLTYRVRGEDLEKHLSSESERVYRLDEMLARGDETSRDSEGNRWIEDEPMVRAFLRMPAGKKYLVDYNVKMES